MTGKEAGKNKNGSTDERNTMKKKLKALLKMETPKTGERERENEGTERGRAGERSAALLAAALARQKKGFSQIKEARQAS